MYFSKADVVCQRKRATRTVTKTHRTKQKRRRPWLGRDAGGLSSSCCFFREPMLLVLVCGKGKNCRSGKTLEDNFQRDIFPPIMYSLIT